MSAQERILPTFRYHPDPIATGSIVRSDKTCACCSKAGGWIYVASVYGPSNLRGNICPWCIASGTAALRYNCSFNDDSPLAEAQLAPAIILEVSRKTPGYSSWQQEVWQACCDDACEFHGDAPASEMKALSDESLVRIQDDWQISLKRLDDLLNVYVPGGGIAIFKFVCRHCHRAKYALDLA